MSKIVLILGDLAAGKSTLADTLSANLDYVCLKKDTIKESLSDVIGFSNREENRKLSIASVNIMTYLLEEILKTKDNAILEANFRSSEIKTISSLADEYSAKLEIIYLYGDYSLIYKRFCDRVPHRNKAHLSMGLDKDFEAFKTYINSIRDDVKDVKAFKVDMTNLGKKEVVDAIMKHFNDVNF